MNVAYCFRMIEEWFNGRLVNRNSLYTIRWFVFGILVLSTIILLVPSVIRISHKVYNSYNEGWNAYHTQQVISGQQLYQNNWTPVNYPPLSFYVIGGISKLFYIDPLYTGRFVALMSLVAITLCIVYIVRRFKGGWYEALFAGIFFLGLFASVGSIYVGLNDPQLLAQEVAMLGLIVYFSKLRKGKLLVTALLFCISLFIKHNIIALPMVITLDIFLISRKDFLKWAGYMTLFLFGFILGTQILSDGNFLYWFLLKREYAVNNIILLTIPILLKISFPLIIVSLFVIRVFKQPIYRLFAWYFIYSLVTALYFSGGNGTDTNMFFDTFISISLLSGLFLCSLLKEKKVAHKRTFWYFGLILLLAANIVFALPYKIIRHDFKTNSQMGETIVQGDAVFISGYPSPVLCDKILLCYFAKQPFIYDSFMMDELVITGKKSEREILMPLENRYFSLIQLSDPIPDYYFKRMEYTALQRRHRYTENFLRAVGKNYHLARVSPNGAFYIPN